MPDCLAHTVHSTAASWPPRVQARADGVVTPVGPREPARSLHGASPGARFAQAMALPMASGSAMTEKAGDGVSRAGGRDVAARQSPGRRPGAFAGPVQSATAFMRSLIIRPASSGGAACGARPRIERRCSTRSCRATETGRRPRCPWSRTRRRGTPAPIASSPGRRERQRAFGRPQGGGSGGVPPCVRISGSTSYATSFQTPLSRDHTVATASPRTPGACSRNTAPMDPRELAANGRVGIGRSGCSRLVAVELRGQIVAQLVHREQLAVRLRHLLAARAAERHASNDVGQRGRRPDQLAAPTRMPEPSGCGPRQCRRCRRVRARGTRTLAARRNRPPRRGCPRPAMREGNQTPPLPAWRPYRAWVRSSPCWQDRRLRRGELRTAGTPMNPRHQFSRPLQRWLCRSSLLPARTSEFDAVRWPLISITGKVLDR